jgi:hypothetical protein
MNLKAKAVDVRRVLVAELVELRRRSHVKRRQQRDVDVKAPVEARLPVVGGDVAGRALRKGRAHGDAQADTGLRGGERRADQHGHRHEQDDSHSHFCPPPQPSPGSL